MRFQSNKLVASILFSFLNLGVNAQVHIRLLSIFFMLEIVY